MIDQTNIDLSQTDSIVTETSLMAAKRNDVFVGFEIFSNITIYD